MSDTNLRKKYAEIFPRIAEVILDERNCYDKIVTLIFQCYKEDEIIERLSDLDDISDLDIGAVIHYSKPWSSEKFRGALLPLRVKTPYDAFTWAQITGDFDGVRDRVTDSKSAFMWARYIGDRCIMRERITDSYYAYLWALNIGDREIMRDRLDTEDSIYMWGKDIGDREILRERVQDVEYARKWARFLGEEDFMKKRFGNKL